DMLAGMVGIEDDQNGFVRLNRGADLFDDLRRCGVALDSGNAMRQTAAVERGPRFLVDVHVNADDAAFAEALAYRGVEQQGTAVVDAGFDDDVGLQGHQNFLNADQIFRQLLDEAAKPRHREVIADAPADPDPLIAYQFE